MTDTPEEAPGAPSTLFPKITGKHADFIHDINYLREHDPEFAKVTQIHMTGTVKLHGTHADVFFPGGDEVRFQSRNRTDLAPEKDKDNSGFAAAMIPHTSKLLQIRDRILRKAKEVHPDVEVEARPEVLVAGEWIGPGVQKKVALNGFPQKMLVILSVSMGGIWQPHADFKDIEDESAGIVNISRGGFYNQVLDVADMETGLQAMQPLADAVEDECPFAKAFGYIGKGEGIVWRPYGPSVALDKDPRFWIKTKGPEFSARPPPKVNLDMKDKVEKARGFAQGVITEIRLQQGWDYMKEMALKREKKNVGEYMKWLWGDVEVEERREIEDMDIDKVALKKEVQHMAKRWYFNKVNSPGD